MTERIDLDDVAVEEADDEADGNDGDWLWRDDGEVAAPDPSTDPSADASGPDADGETADSGADSQADAEPSTAGDRTPHVPHENRDRPVGVPEDGGGAGGAPAAATDDAAEAPRPAGGGPHGGGVDDVTMALTYGAARRLASPARVFASAGGWCDWIGVVGDVPAHVVQKFQRDAGVDADFFNGSGTAPGERLAGIDRNSMFYAARMLVVGLEGEDEPVAETAGWEFVPLSEAAKAADWDLE